MEVDLPYGKNKLRVKIPYEESVDLKRSTRTSRVESPKELINEALDNPIASSPLSQLVKEKNIDRDKADVSIIIDDRTRPCPDDVLVPLIVKRLTSAGIDPRCINVVVATGLHEPPEKREARALAGGDELPEGVKFIGHDANTSDLTKLGVLSDGYGVQINRAVAESRLKIATGFIEPHFFAGFSGGRKSILPGVASQSSITANHSYENIANKNAAAGILAGNPIHHQSSEAAQLAELDFILNVVMNDRKEVVQVVAGGFREAFREGVDYALRICGIELEEAYDAVLTTNSGYPLDQNLYQTVKGIYTASLVAKPEAPIIVASECSEGIGHENFYSLQEVHSNPSSVLAYIEQKGPIVAQWENQVLCHVLKDHSVFLKSELADEQVEKMMMTPIEDVEPLLEKILGSFGEGQKLLIIPEGPFVIPYVHGSRREERIRESRGTRSNNLGS